ncbi:MAG: trehalose-6-phosphate synthase, partial [Chloroflexi bacterium]|nr:trehalose-6-phosphate synthase [Chloroflexota bacterium]
SLLDHYPSLRGKVTLVQIAVPSRTRVHEYIAEKEQVERLVGQINGRFSEPGWIPVEYLYRSYSQEDLVRFYRKARVCLVTPLRDGMNLVAKEYVASQGASPGVLVLSRFCGAAEAMGEAIIVNPYDTRATAEAIHTGLTMPARERRRRWKALYEHVCTATAQEWARTFLGALATQVIRRRCEVACAIPA